MGGGFSFVFSGIGDRGSGIDFYSRGGTNCTGEREGKKTRREKKGFLGNCFGVWGDVLQFLLSIYSMILREPIQNVQAKSRKWMGKKKRTDGRTGYIPYLIGFLPGSEKKPFCANHLNFIYPTYGFPPKTLMDTEEVVRGGGVNCNQQIPPVNH